ncbi:hypothetical protein RCL1_003078 [Eukaryota sp. TZLM3-RCL]
MPENKIVYETFYKLLSTSADNTEERKCARGEIRSRKRVPDGQTLFVTNFRQIENLNDAGVKRTITERALALSQQRRAANKKYIDLSLLPATSCEVERLFSRTLLESLDTLFLIADWRLNCDYTTTRNCGMLTQYEKPVLRIGVLKMKFNREIDST